MSSHSVAPLSGQSRDSPPDIQRGVIANRLWPITMVGDRPTTVLRFCFVDPPNPRHPDENKKQAVRTTISKHLKKEAEERHEGGARDSSGGPLSKKSRSENPYTFATWEEYGNVVFEETTDKAQAHIRITFQGNGSSTVIGESRPEDGANQDNTMRLGDVANVCPPCPRHRRTILHEFGHALGLFHEHEGPHAKELLKLDVEKMKEIHPLDFINDNFVDYVDSNDQDTLWNYTNFDPNSIMVYEIPKEWQKQPDKIEIKLSLELSKYDKACIRLMYPPDLRDRDNHEPLISALNTAGVDQMTASEIIQTYTRDTEGSEADRLTRLRNRFDKWYARSIVLRRSSGGDWSSQQASHFNEWYNPARGVLRGIDPASLRRSGINQFAGEVTKDKLFQSIMKNIVYRAMVQRAIPTKVSIPGAAQTEVTRLIAALSTHGEFGQLVAQCRNALFGDENDNGDKECNPGPQQTLDEDRNPKTDSETPSCTCIL